MNKNMFSRATVKILKYKPIKQDDYIVDNIKLYQEEIKKLGPKPHLHAEFKNYRRELKRFRTALKANRSQRVILQVHLKHYNTIQEIEGALDHSYSDKRKAFKEMIKTAIDHAIRYYRAGNKDHYTRDKFGKYVSDFLGQKKKGRVFVKDGEVLRIYVSKNIGALYEDKKPKEPKKYIGIELEFCAPIKEQELALKLFRSGIHKFAQLKQDGSLRPREDKKEVGFELALLLEEANYKKSLKQVLTLLNSVGAVVEERRAGLHVHLDMRKRNKDTVYNNLVACQYALLSIVDPKRYNNEFCRVVDSRKFPTEFSGERTERYRTINAAAFYKYKTLEVRMHEGSVDYVQITNWIDLLVKIANYSKKMKTDIPKLTVLNKRISINKKLFQYLIDRSCFWQVQNNEYTREMRNEINHRDELRTTARRPVEDRSFDDQLQRILRVDEILGQTSTPVQYRAAVTAPDTLSGSTLTVAGSGLSSLSYAYQPPEAINIVDRPDSVESEDDYETEEGN